MVSKLAQTWVKENSMPLGTEKSSLLGAAGSGGTLELEILVVGGGGSGGGGDRPASGGGGGGGVLHATVYPAATGQEYGTTVGTGGAGGSYVTNNGADSVFDTAAVTGTLTALGGGYGAIPSGEPDEGGDGGSGGGNVQNNSNTPGQGIQAAPTIAGVTVTAYGNDGTIGVYPGGSGTGGGGGGGGSLANAGAATSGVGGAGGVAKQFPSFMAFGVNRRQQATEYATGDRKASVAGGYITVSTDLSIYGGEGTIQAFVNGTTTAGGLQFYPLPGLVVGKYFRFDFTAYAKPIIVGAKWYQSTGSEQGVWKWQGSDDASSWTDIGDNFTLGPAESGLQTQTTMSANTTSYRYYQLEGVSGSVNSVAYWLEIEFKDRAYFAGGGGGAGYSTGGVGGIGGGSKGGGGNQQGTTGLANTGGGGGGGDGRDGSNQVGGDGGTGVLLIRYLGGTAASGGTITNVGGYTYHAYTSTGNSTFTTD